MLGQTADDQVVLVGVQHGNDQFGLRCTHLFEDLGATTVSTEDLAVNLLAQLGDDVRPPVHHFDLVPLPLQILGEVRPATPPANDDCQHRNPPRRQWAINFSILDRADTSAVMCN